MLWRQHFLYTTSTAARILNDVQNILLLWHAILPVDQYRFDHLRGYTGRQMYRVPYSMKRYDSFGRCCICCNGGLCQDESFKGNGLSTSCACNAYNFCGKAKRIPDVLTRPQLQTTPSPELRVNNTTPWFFMSALHWTPHTDLLLIFFAGRYTQRQ